MPINNEFSTRATSQTSPAATLCAVVPNDDADLPEGLTRALYVGVGGDLRVMDGRGNVVTLTTSSTQYHPIRVRRVFSAGTTASKIVALY